MSMYDRSYCSTNCDRKNCKRNLKYHKPRTKFYSVAELDNQEVDASHIRCKFFSLIDEEDHDE